jgi:CBS-domain-containing membrane protein
MAGLGPPPGAVPDPAPAPDPSATLTPQIDPVDEWLPDLTEADVAQGMADIQGFLDISPEDFRELYHAAARHALQRLAGDPKARALMRTGGPLLRPHHGLGVAVASMAGAGVKSAAVVDDTARVIGILTETDVLRRLEARSSLDLLMRLTAGGGGAVTGWSRARVDSLMTAAVISVRAEADLLEMAAAFRRHGGRAMPVVDATGRWLGMLARKDLIHTCALAWPGD